MGARAAFNGRTAIVTGGTSGIGAAVVARLREEGARAAVLDRQETSAADLSIVGDVARSSDVADLVKRVAALWGKVDVLVCCAGIFGRSARTVDVDDDEWHAVHAINSAGVFFANRAVLPLMIASGYGRIVNVASIAGKEGNPLAAAYASSKASVINLTKSIGRDVAGTGVLVNCVAPALIETPMVKDLDPEHKARMAAAIPLGRLGTPEEVAGLVAFLASSEMTFATGACFDLSGGRAVY